MASAALGVAVHLPQLADVHELAANALLVSLAMAALALTGALLQQARSETNEQLATTTASGSPT